MKFCMGRFAALGLIVALGGCQLPGFGGLQQAAVTPPPPPPKRAEPPEARGIWIVGSPAVEPRIKAAAASYEATPDTRPRVAAWGTDTGLRALCAGVGLEHPDMALSERAIRPAEAKRCADKGIMLTEYALGPKQYVYVKDGHMVAVPGVRDFVQSWGVKGAPVSLSVGG